jgi:(2R)-ethylmalonyl-CoA mutase
VTAPVVVGGIIPEQDVAALRAAGVAAVYTPKDFDITRIMHDIVELLSDGETPLAGNGASANGSA